MNLRIVSTCAVLLALPVACDKKTDESADDTAESKADDQGKSEGDGDDEGKAVAADEAGEGGQADEGGDVADAHDEVSADAIRDCPKSLSGRESTDRVIGKACGVVEVTSSYEIDGATLLLEAGATLAFKDGGRLGIGYREPAKLIVKGTKEEPVTFTSGGDKAVGVWKGVVLYPKAARSSIEGLLVEYAGDKAGAVQIQAPDVVFKDSTIQHVESPALEVSKEGRLSDFTGTTFDDVGKIAVRVPPVAAGDILEGNTFKGDARVHVTRGRLEESASWKAIGAPMLVLSEVRVEGSEGTRTSLTIEPGAELHFDADGSLLIGYGGEGRLEVEGTQDKPVVFTSNERKEPGAWPGVAIWDKGEGALEHLTLRYGGKKEDRGVLYVRDHARLEASNVTFEDNSVGLVVVGNESTIETFDNNTFKSTPVAMKIPPRVLGALGGENSYADDTRIVVEGGRVEEEQTWKPQTGAQTEIDSEVRLDKGTITIEPGSTFHMKDGSSILVGYADVARLVAKGKPDAKIRFIGQRDEVGTWKGITFYGKARGSVLEEMEIRNASEPAALHFKNESEATIENLTCAKCEGAVIKRDDGSKVDAKGVEATEGTPSTE